MTPTKSVGDINPSQAQVYKDLKDDLMEVIDVKIPALINSITELAGSKEVLLSLTMILLVLKPRKRLGCTGWFNLLLRKPLIQHLS